MTKYSSDIVKELIKDHDPLSVKIIQNENHIDLILDFSNKSTRKFKIPLHG